MKQEVRVGEQSASAREAAEGSVGVGEQEHSVGAEHDGAQDGSGPIGDVAMATQRSNGFTELGSYKAAWVHADKLQHTG